MGAAMGLMQDHFPVFEANQVLTSGHLNDVFNYLDEQERLTRSNLVGIGIVCGLEIKLDGAAIQLSKGCGVTSQGYLVVEPKDVTLVSYRANYTIPTDPDYAPFKDPTTSTQFPLWELFPDGKSDTTPLTSPANFLDDKAVLLFLELKQQGLRNCSPNSCDDKGSQVTASFKRLLIKRSDLDKIIAAAQSLGDGLTAGELESALLEQLSLPDIHVPRFDVVNTSPLTSNEVYAAFLNIFSAGKMAQSTGKALNAAYDAFKPVLQESYPTNPFVSFDATYGFLDSAPTTTAQVSFLQYYVDLFGDLLCAYDEFRWKGIDLVCACCPPDGLFPRHLMLGLLHPEKVNQPAIYRQGFLPSAAVSNCSGRTKELLQVFGRLVEMAKRFTNAPVLPKPNVKAPMDSQIRITPSVLGDKPLSEKAIPYYYQQNGSPPLYRLWSVEKSRRNRANQNLSYSFDEYSPPAPAFVSSPLNYDIEPYNFLRVEGHLGKHYVHVLRTLLLMKSAYRLPVEFIALRSGAYDDSQPVDLTKHTAHFQDLEAVYDALREELLSSLAEGARYLYDIPATGLKLPGGKPKLSLLKNYASNYQYPADSVGAWYENYLNAFEARPYIDVNQDQIDANAVLTVYCALFAGTTDHPLPNENYAHAVSIYYFSKLAEILPASLDALAYADFENKYEDLLGLIRYFRSSEVDKISTDLKSYVPQEDLIDHFDNVLFSCKLDPIRSVHDEYLKRIRDLRKKQFLSEFLQQHPGIEHKAGVPLGGTFIVVYHAEPATAGNVNVGAAMATPIMANIQKSALADAINRISSNQAFALNPDISLVLGSLTGEIPIFGPGRPVPGLGASAAKIIAEAVNELADGTVIADFYLPYSVSCDCCTAVQFVLPLRPPTFSTQVGCTDANGTATVAVKVKGGVPPYDVDIDKSGYQALGDSLSLNTGTHSLTIRDAEGIESDPQSVAVAAPIVLGKPIFTCNAEFTAYTTTIHISGGTPPYTVNGKSISGGDYTSDPVTSGKSLSIEVLDSNQCSAKTDVTHTCVKPPCDLPCDGIALRRGYRFWLPEPAANAPYTELNVGKTVFSFDFPTKDETVNLSAEVQAIIQKLNVADLNKEFDRTVTGLLDQINKLIAQKTEKPSWLTLSYEAGQPGGLGTLWIEHFECLNFDIQLSSTFQRPETTEQLNLAYAPALTTVQSSAIGRTAIKIPAFDGTRADKCNPQTPVEPLCPKTPDMKLTISKQVSGMTAALKVTASGTDKATAFLWEIQDAKPAMATTASVKVTFTATLPTIKQFTVTAFTKGGCRVMAADKVEIAGII